MPNALLTANGEAMPRHRLEAYIEQLIDLLDAMDGEPDLEPDIDEPSLGWTESKMQLGGRWYPDNTDIEGDPLDAGELDLSDYEPEDAEPWRVPVHLVDMEGVQ